MAIGRSEGLLHSIGQGYSALDAQAARDKLDGFAVIDGLAVTAGTGLSVDVASGSAMVGESGGTVDTVSNGSSTNVALSSADPNNPRKDTIYIDTNGDLQAETGTAEGALPSGNTQFETFQPEPPEPGTAGTILAEVWVGAGASSLASADIRDRRMPADIVADDVAAQGLRGDVAGGNTITNLLGQGLEFASGALRVLNTIWDGTNIVADVNNSSVTTGELVIGGTLYEEDANSPVNASGATVQYTVSNTYNSVVIIPQRDGLGHDELQVNGDTGTNYDFVDNSDTATTGANQWTIGRLIELAFMQVFDERNGTSVRLHVASGSGTTGRTVSGSNTNAATGTIDTLTFKDSSGVSRGVKARIYGRDTNV